MHHHARVSAVFAALLAAATVLAACGGPKPAPVPETAEPVATSTPTEPSAHPVPEIEMATEPAAVPTPPPAPSDPPGAACLRTEDCGEGLVCEGEGCGDDTPGTCQPAQRICTRDLRPYCSCDGTTFQASGSCPGTRYAAKGPCPPSAKE